MASKQYGLKLSTAEFNTRRTEGGAGLLVEQLRYAGIVNREGQKEFTIWCPPGLNGSVWQSQNSDRMASFGIHAEKVEKT